VGAEAAALDVLISQCDACRDRPEIWTLTTPFQGPAQAKGARNVAQRQFLNNSKHCCCQLACGVCAGCARRGKSVAQLRPVHRDLRAAGARFIDGSPARATVFPPGERSRAQRSPKEARRPATWVRTIAAKPACRSFGTLGAYTKGLLLRTNPELPVFSPDARRHSGLPTNPAFAGTMRSSRTPILAHWFPRFLGNGLPDAAFVIVPSGFRSTDECGRLDPRPPFRCGRGITPSSPTTPFRTCWRAKKRGLAKFIEIG